MTTKRIILFLLFNFLIIHSYSQNETNYLSIGSNTFGICFGNPNNYNGLRINIFDRKVVSKINGIQISCLSNYSKEVNGLSIAGIWQKSNRINGLAVSFGIDCDTLNGVFLGFGIGAPNRNVECRIINGIPIGVFVNAEDINGVAVGLFEVYSKRQFGLSVSFINNTDELHGLQIGLLNYAGNNPKVFKWMPIINFHR